MRLRLNSPRFWFLQLGLALGWIGIWHVGRLLEYTPHTSLWFPPAALTLALFLAQGPSAAVPVMVGAVVATFHSAALYGDPRSAPWLLLTGLTFGIVHASAYGFGAWLIRRLSGSDRLATPGSVVRFLIIVTFASLAAAVAGIVSLTSTGTFVEGGLAKNLVPWWIGDLVAVVTLAPLLLVAMDYVFRRMGLPQSGWSDAFGRLRAHDLPARSFLVKLAVAAGSAALLCALATIDQLGLPVALVVYVLIVPLMWIAHTEGGLRTVIGVAVLATVVVLVTRLFGLTEQAFNYQAAMIAIAATGLFNLTVPRLYAANRRLLHLVTFDQLTGARARSVFLEAAQDLLERRVRYDMAVSLLLFDIDHFKRVNDTFGHAAGDAVLAEIGRISRQELRAIDLLGRIGGEEFAVLVPRATREKAVALADRLRTTFESADWQSVHIDRPVTASFGVVSVKEGESIGEALDRADGALYEAKGAGRNRVCVA